MIIIDLPTVAVNRKVADELMDNLRGDTSSIIKLNGRDLDINSHTFVTQLIKRISDAGFNAIELSGGGGQWYETVRQAARIAGLSTRVVPA